MGRSSANLLVFLVCLLAAAVGMAKEIKKMKELAVTSPAFTDGGSIPVRYTCDGPDISPPLALAAIPSGTRSLALIVDDPDAPSGTWVHWVMWNISADTRDIKEGQIPSGAMQGQNDWKRNSYNGPCPPSGTHRYLFKIFALDTTLDLPPSTTKTSLERAMHGHIIAQGLITGKFRRR
jgi:Raf kinase inhibitor-like YbhB/YbcL family protein